MATLIDRFKDIGLQWLEMRDQSRECTPLSAYCESVFPGPENAQTLRDCLSFLSDIDRFDRALQCFLAQSDSEVPCIPGYVFLEQIAAGGMGIVWHATDERLDRPVAIKVMKVSARNLPQATADFQHEAQLTARLAHPNLVPVYQQGVTSDGRCYYVMKLIQGESLAQRLRRGLSAVKERTELLIIFSKVCQGVAFAHRQGIIHCDLKPENIMIGLQGEVQVMDWGLAREINRKSEHAVKCIHAICGTPGYMSPQQAAGSGELDGRSDVFSLGVILSALLTGTLPHCFRIPNVADCTSSLHLQFKTLGVDPRLSRIATRCVSLDPTQRPADAIELAASLDDYLYGMEREKQRRQLWRKLAIASLLFAFIAAIGLFEYQRLWQSERSARNVAEVSRERTRRILDEWSLNVVDPWLELRPDELSPARCDLMERMQVQYDQLLTDGRQSPEVVAACAKSLRRIGQMRVINSDCEGAYGPLKRARELVEELLRISPQQLELQEDLAMICHVQGAMFDSLSPPLLDDSFSAYEVAISQLRQLVDQSHSIAYSRKLARSCISQAFVLRVMQEHRRGLELVNEAIDILRAPVADPSSEWLCKEDLASALNVRYLLFTDTGEPQLAEQSLREAIVTRDLLATAQPDFQKNNIRLGINYGNLGKHLNVHAEIDEALRYYHSATKILEPIFKRNPLPECRSTLRNVYSRRALVYEQLGSKEEAISDWKAAVSMETESKRPFLNARLALAEGSPLEAVQIVAALRANDQLASEQLFDFARIYARASALVGDEEVRHEFEFDALSLLDEALSSGYRVLYENDPAIIRDFRSLIRWPEVEAKLRQ